MDHRLFYPATERNRDFILEILTKFLPKEGRVLEIASGSGEHIVHFAKAFPLITWQPSDLEEECLASIQAWTDFHELSNIEPPLNLDTTKEWDLEPLDALVCINMVHISPWEATVGLMEKAGELLRSEGTLYLYGPYKKDGQHTAPSNESFEEWLKEQDLRFGVRNLEDVQHLGEQNGLSLSQIIDMPANNFSLVFNKT